MSQKINIMTFNIRYDEPSDSLDNWHLRKMEMADFIMGKKPLVLGIQEGLHHQVKYLNSALVNFAYVGCGTAGHDREGRRGGQAAEEVATLDVRHHPALRT